MIFLLAGPQGPATGRPLTVLTFNALDGAADLDAVAALIRTERPDLAALIEVSETYRDRLAPLVGPLGYRMVTATGTDMDGVTDVFGVTALVAGHLGEVTSNVDRSTQFPIVEVGAAGIGTTRFVAFHAVAPRVGDVAEWSSDVSKVARYCGAGPAIVAGDFNATLAAEDVAVREVAGSDHRAVLVRLRLPE